MAEPTTLGFGRSEVREKGTLAMFVLAASLLFVQPWLAQRGLAWLGIVVMLPLALFVVWSTIEDIRTIRAAE